MVPDNMNRLELLAEIEKYRKMLAEMEDVLPVGNKDGEARSESEEQYRLLVEECFDGIFVQKGQKIVFANSRLYEMLGYECDELEGKDHWLIYHPDYQDLTRKRAQARMRGEDPPSQYEVLLQRKDGSHFEGEIRAKVVQFEGVPGVQVWVRDITERKRSVKVLAESEARFRSTFEQAAVGMGHVAADGQFLRVNRRLCDIVGYTSDQLMQMKFTDITHPDHLKSDLTGLQQLIDDEIDTYLTEKRYIRSDGSTVWVQLTASHSKQFGGDQKYIITVVEDISARKEAERQLWESQERLRRLSEAAEEGIAIHDQGAIIDANEALARIFGYELNELIGMSGEHIAKPESWKEIQNNVETGYEQPYEVVGVRKDGSEVWCRIAGKPLYVDDKELRVATFTDITWQKEAERQLRKWEQIFEHAEWGVAIAERGGPTIDMMNPAFARMHGYPVKELTGKSITDIYPPEAHAELHKSIQIAHEKGHLTFESQHVRKDGSVFPVLVDATVVKDDEENVLYRIVNVQDITERKKAEEELRASEEKYRTILENIADGYHETDLDGNLTLFNKSLHESVGYSREELLGTSFRKLMTEEMAAKVYAEYNHIFLTGEPNPDISWMVKRKDGTKAHISASVSPIKDENGQITGFRGIMRDVTDRVRLEEKLQQAAKMEAIGRLAGGIAHDFNNLLTAVLGYSNLLTGQMPNDSPHQEKLKRIHCAAERAAALTKQLLAFSRKQVLDVRVLDLNQVIGDMQEMLRRIIGEDIELEAVFDPSLGRVRVDPGQIEQIIMNLVVNARDAMPHGGRLTIETQNVFLDEEYAQRYPEVDTGHYVMLAVSDNGVGMDRETLASIFDPFFTTKEKDVGTGLGLSTVYGIVKQHHGHVAVYSEFGHGSTFKVYLPRVEEMADRMPSTVHSETYPQGTETILAVEDEDIVRDLACELLEMLGYTPLSASDPEEALAICSCHEGPIHLVLTDVILPHMDGRSLFERIALIRPDARVLYVSGYTENFIVHHGVLDRNVHFMQKPFTMESLAAKVRKVLDEP